MPRLLVLVSVLVVAMTLGVALPEDSDRDGSDRIEGSTIRTGSTYPRNRNAIAYARTSSLFFLHLLKHKAQQQKLQKIVTTLAPATTTARCICVPFYLCNANQSIITDGTGVIDVRAQQCSGLFEVCCYLRTTTTARPTVTPFPTLPTLLPTIIPIPTITPIPTIPPTVPPLPTIPTILPTLTPFPTVPPVLNCICVNISMCDPNGIVTISGEGVINPRYGFCPGTQVCCRLLATTTTTTTTTTTARPATLPPVITLAPLITLPSAQSQVCFVCDGAVQCVSCGIIVAPGSGAIIPRVFSSRDGDCLVSMPSCRGTTTTSPSSLVELLGPPRNSGTGETCHCVKTWQCGEGNVVEPDGLGIIDSRFTPCPSADEVCCRFTGIDLRPLRSVAASSSETDRDGPYELSSLRTTCGSRNSSYSSPQSLATDSGRTHFAEFPWMVALLVKFESGGSYAFHCGASLINERTILTAAHCVADQKLENLAARFGQWNIMSNAQPLPSQQANVHAMSVHPLYYGDGLFHDVAVLVLDRPVAYGPNVQPICLPEQSTVFAAGTRCYGTGWGSDSLGPEARFQSELRKVNLPIVDSASCQNRLRGTKLGQHFQLHGSFICAGGEGEQDLCRGDGGGPLACQVATGQFYQAGIISWGIGCGVSDVPAVYTSVSQHRQWIDRQLATYGVQ